MLLSWKIPLLHDVEIASRLEVESWRLDLNCCDYAFNRDNLATIVISDTCSGRVVVDDGVKLAGCAPGAVNDFSL